MLLETVVDLFFGLIELVIDLLPSFDFKINLAPVQAVSVYFGYADNFVDMKAVSVALGFAFLVINAGFIVRIFNFIIRKIPTIS